jgi:hypothetical protein
MAGLTWPLSDDTAEEVLDGKLCRRARTITQPHDLRRSHLSTLPGRRKGRNRIFPGQHGGVVVAIRTERRHLSYIIVINEIMGFGD